ncbi:tRNA-intron lyase [Ranunculus cassubicifolius]
MVVPGTRWKNENSESFAIANPMSKLVSELQSSLIQSKACGFLSHAVGCMGSCVVLLEVCNELADLLNQACFGCCIVTTDTEKRQYELTLEEAFYLFHHLKCLEIVWENKRLESSNELWKLITSKQNLFPVFYKAYSHLRAKNWVVRSEIKYGVDFVAYHHHPSLVHSEYAVMVSAGNDDINLRLMAWPSIHATVRLEDGVAKTLLILYVKDNACDGVSSLCLQHYTVEEQIIARWNPDQCLQDHTDTEIG